MQPVGISVGKYGQTDSGKIDTRWQAMGPQIYVIRLERSGTREGGNGHDMQWDSDRERVDK